MVVYKGNSKKKKICHCTNSACSCMSAVYCCLSDLAHRYYLWLIITISIGVEMFPLWWEWSLPGSQKSNPYDMRGSLNGSIKQQTLRIFGREASWTPSGNILRYLEENGCPTPLIGFQRRLKIKAKLHWSSANNRLDINDVINDQVPLLKVLEMGRTAVISF